MGNTINDWRFYHKKGFNRIRSKIRSEELVLRTNYFRNFEFRSESIPEVHNMLESEFGSGNLKTEHDDDDPESKYQHYWFENSGNGLICSIDGTADEKPFWGYCAILGINDTNMDEAMKLSEKIDTLLPDYPMDIPWDKIFSPLFRPFVATSYIDGKVNPDEIDIHIQSRSLIKYFTLFRIILLSYLMISFLIMHTFLNSSFSMEEIILLFSPLVILLPVFLYRYIKLKGLYTRLPK